MKNYRIIILFHSKVFEFSYVTKLEKCIVLSCSFSRKTKYLSDYIYKQPKNCKTLALILKNWICQKNAINVV